MILDLIVQIGLTLVGGMIGLFPAFTLPGSMSGFGGGIGSAAATLNGVFPVLTLGICLGAVILVRLWLTAWGVLVFVYDKIPFKAT